MNKEYFYFLITSTIASCCLAFDVRIGSGTIPLPDASGAFTGTSTMGHSVQHSYFTLSDAQYADYISADEALRPINIFSIFLEGAQNWTQICNYPNITSGFSRFYASSLLGEEMWNYDIQVNLAAIYVYVSEAHVTNFIARVISFRTPTEEEEDDYRAEEGFDMELSETDIALAAGKWSIWPPVELELTCSGISVSDTGVVTASFTISDFSRLNELVTDATTMAVVAPFLDRQGETTVSASVVNTDAETSSITISFTPDASWSSSSLFIFGLEAP